MGRWLNGYKATDLKSVRVSKHPLQFESGAPRLFNNDSFSYVCKFIYFKHHSTLGEASREVIL